MENDAPSIGILGLETHGTNYAEVLTALDCPPVCGADADPTARREFRERFGATTYENLSNLLEADLDAVIVCTPTKFHEPTATAALEHGLDVFLETPLSHDLESAENIAAVAEETDNICMVGFYERFRNICDVTKSYIEEGYFGEIIHIHGKFVRRRGVPGRGTWYTSKDIAGGGALMDIGGHLLDLLLYFLEWPELSDIMATSRSDFGHHKDYSYIYMWGDDGDAKMYDVEDSVTAFCQFDTDTTATIEVAWATNTESEHSYTIRGTEAGAFLDLTDTLPEVEPVPDRRNHLELYEARSNGTDHFVNSDVVAPSNYAYHDELRMFIDAVRSGDRPEANNIHQGLAVQCIIDEIYRAGTDD